MMLALVDHRPAHLTRVHQALVALPESERRRLGVVVPWKSGPHLLTYRQTDGTFSLVVNAFERQDPDGTASDALAAVVDAIDRGLCPPRDGRKRQPPGSGRDPERPGKLRPGTAAHRRPHGRPRSPLVHIDGHRSRP